MDLSFPDTHVGTIHSDELEGELSDPTITSGMPRQEVTARLNHLLATGVR